MNTVQLIGRIATDIRLSKTTNDNDRASFKLAVDRPTKDEEADFVWVNCWNGTAKALAEYRSKGDEVAIEGSIRTSRKALGDGKFQDYVEISARRVSFLRTKGGGPTSVEASTPEPSDLPVAAEGDDIPF